MLDACLARGPENGSLRVDWHLGAGDFEPQAAARLAGLARRALEGASLAFVFDRPRRAITLAEGLNRQHPAALLAVALNLPWLVGQLGPNPEPAAFLKKLGSLARLALSAASQKRDFLRRHGAARPALTRGFLLERARLVVVPVGLDAVVQAISGRGLCAGGTSLEFGRQVIGRLRDVLSQDGRAYLLEAGLDSALPQGFLADDAENAGGPIAPERAVGLTPSDEMASVKGQLRTAGLLHAAAEAGTAMVRLPGERSCTPEDLVGWLRYAWQQTEIVRVRFLRGTPAPRQLRAVWSEPE